MKETPRGTSGGLESRDDSDYREDDHGETDHGPHLPCHQCSCCGGDEDALIYIYINLDVTLF